MAADSLGRSNCSANKDGRRETNVLFSFFCAPAAFRNAGVNKTQPDMESLEQKAVETMPRNLLAPSLFLLRYLGPAGLGPERSIQFTRACVFWGLKRATPPPLLCFALLPFLPFLPFVGLLAPSLVIAARSSRAKRTMHFLQQSLMPGGMISGLRGQKSWHGPLFLHRVFPFFQTSHCIKKCNFKGLIAECGRLRGSECQKPFLPE